MPKDDIENCSVILGVAPFDKIEMGPGSVTQGLHWCVGAIKKVGFALSLYSWNN